MPKKPPRRDPIIVYKREEKGLKPFLPKARGGFRFGPPQRPQRPRKPKETKAVVPEKVRFHAASLAEMEALPSPEKEIATACYYLCFLVHETKTSTDLFPLKHNVLEKIFKSGHNCLTVNYVRRGDREIYHLSPEAKKSWETETGGTSIMFGCILPPSAKWSLKKAILTCTISTSSWSRSGFPFISRFTRRPG